MTTPNLLTLGEAAAHLKQTRRWFYRNWPSLVREGVKAHRIPLHSPKGRIYFDRASLDAYLEFCEIKADFTAF